MPGRGSWQWPGLARSRGCLLVIRAHSGYSRDAMDEANGESPDSRDSTRQPIELKVEYKRLNSFFSDYTRNISKGGTFIRTGKPLDVGTEFVFKLHVPTLEDPLRIRGRVQWVVTREDLDAGRGRGQDEPGMGIRFMYRDDRERNAIEKRVESVMVESLGQRLYSKLMEHSQSEGDAPESPDSFSGQSDSFAGTSLSGPADPALVRRKRDD